MTGCKTMRVHMYYLHKYPTAVMAFDIGDLYHESLNIVGPQGANIILMQL
jgi:hypothetical protein